MGKLKPKFMAVWKRYNDYSLMIINEWNGATYVQINPHERRGPTETNLKRRPNRLRLTDPLHACHVMSQQRTDGSKQTTWWCRDSRGARRGRANECKVLIRTDWNSAPSKSIRKGAQISIKIAEIDAHIPCLMACGKPKISPKNIPNSNNYMKKIEKVNKCWWESSLKTVRDKPR